MSNNLIDVLEQIFGTYNYTVGAKNDFDLVAEKPNNNVAIRVMDNPGTEDVRQFADMAKAEGCKALIVSMTYFTEDVKKAARVRDVMIWDRAELEKQIGKAVLLRIDADRDPFASSPEPAPAEKKEVSVSALTQELYGSAPEKPKAARAAAGKAVAAEPRPEPRQEVFEAEDGPAVAADVAVAEEPEVEEEPLKLPIKCYPVKIKATDAVKISGNIGRAEDTEVTLNFIPYWKYDYSLDVMGKYRDLTVPMTGKGSKMINAINRNVDAVPNLKLIDGVEVPDAPYHIQQAALTEEEARAMAIKSIIDDHTRTIRLKGTQGEAAIVEHKKFSPKPTDIKFAMEMLYVPFWSVRSHKGYMEINAYDGKPTQTPMDDGAEIL
ncbi:restriction endonuclease [Methanocella arvoryzae]|uniref:Restriction endonuclease type IV Mrr domain-containing protein n=1 Tax=Methanocella arvoryzae (strain DSM 22066 / NBRC 105507 / MRE50) TaxID=351160 RepID=Q0W778_METAR|nr:restriction endonuclease [Methanocella arvoryzae]CAJ35765.1 conserved hypothetical protein [Methanocella arvoryzae MRE50]